MTDFTKEELQIILLDMTTYVNRTLILNESPGHKKLRDKLQHMIHNYCQHDWDVKIYNKQPGNFKCKNCGIFLNE